MNYFPDSSSTRKSTDSGYSLHESISSNDYETNSESSGSFTCNEDIEEYKQIASVIVNELISKAIAITSCDETSEQSPTINDQSSFNDLELNKLLPAIQIDLVASRAQSPDEFTWANVIGVTSESYNDDASGNNIEEENNSKANENHRLYTMRNSNIESRQTDEVIEFAKKYVKNIIETAIDMTLVTSSTRVSLRDEFNRTDSGLPWYLRIREILIRLMRSACMCKSKENFCPRKT